ncbi:hypothetical protein ACOXXX_01130 [Thalassococcus sp. BH17M4-6]|uniref:hypothetical protein n=1 Tax=Thalassococcus sp. BH17M4-6 TaxID=3413148 RepID=UPI003BB9DEB6
MQLFLRVGFLALFLSGQAFAAPISLVPNAPHDLRARIEALSKGIVLNAACCKTCRKGKACGDSCISRNKSCHKGVGCACDG